MRHFGSRRHGGGRGTAPGGSHQLATVRLDGSPSVVGAVAGAYLAGVLPESALLLAIAAVLLQSGFDLLRWKRSTVPAEAFEDRRLDLGAAVLSGLVIGLLGGLVGLILGALRLPALLELVGEAPARAGTNLTMGVVVGWRALSATCRRPHLTGIFPC